MKIGRHRFPFASTLALVLVFGLVADARASIITPSGLSPGDRFRIVFVTTTLTDAITNNLTHYDTIVRGDALAGGLGTYYVTAVTWEAIGSTDTLNAITRLPADDVPIFLPDGTEVAATGAALWNSANVPLLHVINETATGAFAGLDPIYTGTRGIGTVAPGAGFGDTPFVETGIPVAVNASWVHFVASGPSQPMALYGFSDVLTVPGQAPSAVPEPGSLALVFAGIAALAGTSLKRHPRKSSCRPASAS